jgi:CIC family chloride channel protein
MAATSSAGGVGGIFAPAMFVGGLSGAFLANGMNIIGFTGVSEKNMTLTGMGGLIAGTMHAPLTGIFLIAEITGGYQLFIPLIVVSVISYAIVHIFRKDNIYTHRLIERGELLTHDKDQHVLTLLNMNKLIEKEFTRLKMNDKLRKLIEAIGCSKRNIFPVENDDGTYAGVVYQQNVRDIMFNSELYDKVSISELVEKTSVVIHRSDSMKIVATKFETSNEWNLPVLDENNKLLGFISKSRVFTEYRGLLKDVTDE